VGELGKRSVGTECGEFAAPVMWNGDPQLSVEEGASLRSFPVGQRHETPSDRAPTGSG